jgi:hypothetical protein
MNVTRATAEDEPTHGRTPGISDRTFVNAGSSTQGSDSALGAASGGRFNRLGKSITDRGSRTFWNATTGGCEPRFIRHICASRTTGRG